jgi:thymidylate synthase (FAD)
VRYRHASFAQQSQRYVEGVPEFVVPESIRSDWSAADEFEKALERVKFSYNYLIKAYQIPPEDARYILPNAACTNITITVNAAELRHMMRQRLCNRAQWEIRALVGEMAELARGVAPVLFEGVGPACLNGKCTEGKLSCGKPPKAEV